MLLSKKKRALLYSISFFSPLPFSFFRFLSFWYV